MLFSGTQNLLKSMMMWGDIILQHPELIKEIPKDIIMLNWGYEVGHNYATTKQFAETGLRQFVCPGTSSWNVLFPRINNSNTNIRSFVKIGLSCTKNRVFAKNSVSKVSKREMNNESLCF